MSTPSIANYQCVATDGVPLVMPIMVGLLCLSCVARQDFDVLCVGRGSRTVNLFFSLFFFTFRAPEDRIIEGMVARPGQAPWQVTHTATKEGDPTNIASVHLVMGCPERQGSS